jgi:hypothetical protein
MHISKSWNLIWTKDGYRDTLNNKIDNQRSDEYEIDIVSFEKYLAQEYSYIFEELTRFSIQTLDHFEELKNKLIVKTIFGSEVKPVVFRNAHMHLQPDALINVKEGIKKTH